MRLGPLFMVTLCACMVSLHVSCTATVELPANEAAATTAGVGGGGGCGPGMLDCDAAPANGCETDTANDPANCGSCGVSCTPRMNETARCIEGACDFACAEGWGDCDGDVNNGCETDTTVSMAHCGGCNQLCDGTNGVAACEEGSCVLDCNTSFGDCNDDTSDGCETNVGIEKEHCGACDLPCATDCVGGICTLASGLSGLAEIEVNATHVYATWGGSGDEVVRVALTGGPVQTIAGAQPGASGLALDAQYVYWSATSSGTVARTTLAGGPIQPIATGIQAPLGIAVDGTHAYWADGGTFGGTTGSVGRAPIGGGGPVEPLATQASFPRAVAVDATHVFWASHNLSSIMRADLDGQDPTPIATNQYGPLALALDSTSVYWVTYDGNAVMKAPKAGGIATPLANPDSPSAIAIDATYVYFATFASDQVSKVPIAGGNAIPVVLGSAVVTDLAVDDKAVYWIQSNAGNILRTAK